ncbi:MAG: hypothetical protein Q8936_20965 [Bacillota bacterium]|nr:hypothetical protein [Bacillota bacterium]
MESSTNTSKMHYQILNNDIITLLLLHQRKKYIMTNTNKTAVESRYQLYTPVRVDLYYYIIL